MIEIETLEGLEDSVKEYWKLVDERKVADESETESNGMRCVEDIDEDIDDVREHVFGLIIDSFERTEEA